MHEISLLNKLTNKNNLQMKYHFLIVCNTVGNDKLNRIVLISVISVALVFYRIFCSLYRSFSNSKEMCACMRVYVCMRACISYTTRLFFSYIITKHVLCIFQFTEFPIFLSVIATLKTSDSSDNDDLLINRSVGFRNTLTRRI